MSETSAPTPEAGWTPCGTGAVFDADAIERAIADIAAGRAVVVVDDEDRENEGDLIFAAEKATPRR